MLLVVIRSVTNVLRVQSRFVKLVRPVSSANRELHNEKFMPTVGFNLGPSAYEANALRSEISELINIDYLKVTAVYMSVLLNDTCTT